MGSHAVDAGTNRTFTTIAWRVLPLLVLITLGAAVVRVVTDWPYILDGTLPEEGSFEFRYVLHPTLTYFHIGLGVVYLLGAPLQLSRRFRTTHYTVHRRMGRVVLPIGLVAGVLGIVVGTVVPFGGFVEASAAVVFGHYYVVALATAFLAIKRGDVATHRRWMIRAFAIAVGVATIRIWLGLFALTQLWAFEDYMGPAFWLAFLLHALAAEVYLRRRPALAE